MWGVLNVVNMMHGSLVMLAAISHFAWHSLRHSSAVQRPAISLADAICSAAMQLMINRVVSQPVLTTMAMAVRPRSLRLYNFMTVYYSATPGVSTLDVGTIDFLGSIT